MTNREKLEQYRERLIKGDPKVVEELQREINRLEEESRRYHRMLREERPLLEKFQLKESQEDFKRQATQLKSLLVNHR